MNDIFKIFINTDKGRILRPLLILYDGTPRLENSHLADLAAGNITFRDLVIDGIVEWVDAEEEEDFDEDEENDLDYTSILLQYRTDIAATGSYVHVAWIDYDSYNGGYDIIYTKSSNNGNSWSEPESISTASSPGGVTVAASGSNIVISWVDFGAASAQSLYREGNT